MGHTLKPPKTTITTQTTLFIFQVYMLLIFIFSFSFKQLSWYSALKERQNSNRSPDESSATYFDFRNWAKGNLRNLNERNDRHCAARTGKIPSPINDLACRPSDQEYRDWSTKSHTMISNYLLDQITLLRQSRKLTFYSPTETESGPALDKTDIK